MSVGGGAQPGSEQANRTTSIDYGFFTHPRSPRQHLQVGVSLTRVATNASLNKAMYAVSVFPQLTLYPEDGSFVARRAPNWAEPYFFVRALGPTYLSANVLGDRVQDNHFAFLAQVGAGVLIDFGEHKQFKLALSWKHFSNANLFDDNDGIDMPFVISWGARF